jgi:hypothetical protein
MRRRAALALALAAAAVLLGLAIAGRTALATWVLRSRLEARGIAPVALRVARLDARGLEARELALGPPAAPDLAVERIVADWSWRSLIRARLDALHVSGARLRAVLGDDGLHFGALDPLRRAGGAAAGAPALPAPAIELRDARARIDTPRGTAELGIEGALAAQPDDRLAGEFALRLEHPLARARGTLRISGTPADLGFAVALDGQAPVTGRIEARGHARLAGAAELELDVALRGVGFESPLARVSGLNGTIALRGPPFHTPKGQLLSVALVDPGLPLTDGLVDFQLREDGSLAVRRAEWHWAGGTLGTGDLLLDPRAADRRAVLALRGVDLALLLAQLKLPGLEGSGRIEGDLPLALHGEAIEVRGGALHAAPGGTIRYRPSGSTQAFAASRPNDLGLAFSALSDFRYEALEAHLDGDLRGAMRIGVHLRGANPAFQDGRPIELNLNLDARLADLVRAGLESYRVPQVIEERLRAFSEQEGR